MCTTSSDGPQHHVDTQGFLKVPA
jgi:hypothetical protein